MVILPGSDDVEQTHAILRCSVASRFVCKSFEGFLGPVGVHAVKDAVEDAFTSASG